MHHLFVNALFISFAFITQVVANEKPQPAIRFIENKNQWSNDIDYSANIPGGVMRIGAGMFRYHFVDQQKLHALHERTHHSEASLSDEGTVDGHTVNVSFLNFNKSSRPYPFSSFPEYYNYFLGNDKARWASEVQAYAGMLYTSFYDKIDLKVYSSGENVKYDFIVAPYADVNQIELKYEGYSNLYLDNGNLYLETSLGTIIEKRPYVYQVIDGIKKEISCYYRLKGSILSFDFPEGYDPCYELVIDPLLIFSTYSGSTADNWGSTATPGEKGTLYSAGTTSQQYGGHFPATAGAFQFNSTGKYDIGILKYDSSGQQLLFATYLGGSDSESPHSLVVDANNDLIVLGTTASGNFPTSDDAFDRQNSFGTTISHVFSYGAGCDIFIAKLNSTGSVLKGSTFLGGSANDGLNPRSGDLVKNYGDELRGDVITNAQGDIFISTVTSSNDFPAVNSFQTQYRGGATDALVAKLSGDLTQLIWSAFVGGAGADASHTIKLDKDGNLYIAGGTSSNDFVMTPGGYQINFRGQVDGWIARIAGDGSSIMQSTLTGTPGFDQIYFLDLNDDGDVYVYGQTDGDFPIFPATVYHRSNSGQFLQKFNSTLTSAVFSTRFGSGRGIPDISPTAFLVNDCNNIYMTGWGGDINSMQSFWNSDTQGLHVSDDAFQKTTSGSDFYFIVLTDDASQFLYGTYLGGTQSKTHVDGGTSRFDKSGVVYHAVCSGCAHFNVSGQSTSDFPTTPGAWSRENRSDNCNNAAFKFDLSSLKANFIKPADVVCIPEKIVFKNLSIGGEIFEWDMGDGNVITKTDTSAVIYEYEQEGQYTIMLKVIDQGTCKVEDEFETIINVFKAVSSVQDDDAICEGDSYQLQASGGETYYWQSEDGLFESNSPSPVITPVDTTQYFITLTEAQGCIRKDTVQINVVHAINPLFDYARESDCETRSSIKLVNLTDSINATDNVFFDLGDGSTSDQKEVTHLYEEDGLYTVKVVGIREMCVYESSVDIPVFTLKVPNVITPSDKDGNNDVFTVQFGNPETTPSDYGFKVSLMVYNRWGAVVYQNNDYQYDWAGEELASGIYYYEVMIDQHTACKSWLHILK